MPPRSRPLITGERRKGSATGTNGSKKYKDIDELAVSLVQQAREQTSKAPLNIKFTQTTSRPTAFIGGHLATDEEKKAPYQSSIFQPKFLSDQYKHPGIPKQRPILPPQSGRVIAKPEPRDTDPDSYYLFQNSSDQWIVMYTDSAFHQSEIYLSQLMDPKDVKDLNDHVTEFQTLLGQNKKPEILNQNPVGRALRHLRNNSQKIVEFECRKYEETAPNVIEFIYRTINQPTTQIFTYKVTLENNESKFHTEPSHPNENQTEMESRIYGLLLCYKENKLREGCSEPITVNLKGDETFRKTAEKISENQNLKLKVLNPLKDDPDKDKDKTNEKKEGAPKKESEKSEGNENIIRTVRR